VSEEQTSIRLKNDLSELERLRELVTEFAGRHEVSPELLFHLNLALEEVLTNVISYGYDDSDEHELVVRLRFQKDELWAEVEDDGRAFNPLDAPTPETQKPLEERPIGGLGIHLVRKLMDGLEYRRQAGKNLLVLKKKIREG
jgi:anti-sigma regulatory factor (Ser/Thr protein kinase)